VIHVQLSRIRAAAGAAALAIGLLATASCGNNGRVEHHFVADSDQPRSTP